MTAQEVIDRVRLKLKDTFEPYRIKDAEMLVLLSDAILEARARRVDLVMGTDGTASSVVEVTTVGDTLSFPDRFREALACHVAYQSYISEDADRHNTSQANAMLDRFEMLIKTV
jgi:hypothetical protein